MAAVAQLAVRGGDGGAADREGDGQLPLRGQAYPQRQPPVEQQPAHSTGERGVVGQATAGRLELPLAEQTGQLWPLYHRRHGQTPKIGSFTSPDWP